jgi:hypothetical protein
MDTIRLAIITGHYGTDLPALAVIAVLAAGLPVTWEHGGDETDTSADEWMRCMDMLREHAPSGYRLDYQQGPEGKAWLASPKGTQRDGRWLCYIPDPNP